MRPEHLSGSTQEVPGGPRSKGREAHAGHLCVASHAAGRDDAAAGCGGVSAVRAYGLAGFSARRRSTHPSLFTCLALAMASAPGGTSSVIEEPAAM